MKISSILCASLCGILLTGCSGNTKQTNANRFANVDPYESYNRFMFEFNMDLNKGLLEPAVDIYDTALPPVARTGVHNFYDNINMPVTIGNDLLQGNFKWAGDDVARFVVNTIFGLGGLVDVASTAHLYPRTQSFGLTLAKWGYKNSAYFVLPVLGPSTIRGTLGLAPDFYMNPVNYMPHRTPYYAFKGVEYAQVGSDVLPKMKFITDNALDPYIALRNAYLQNRQHLIQEVDAEGNVHHTHQEKPSKVVHIAPNKKPHQHGNAYTLTELA